MNQITSKCRKPIGAATEKAFIYLGGHNFRIYRELCTISLSNSLLFWTLDYILALAPASAIHLNICHSWLLIIIIILWFKCQQADHTTAWNRSALTNQQTRDEARQMRFTMKWMLSSASDTLDLLHMQCHTCWCNFILTTVFRFQNEVQ